VFGADRASLFGNTGFFMFNKLHKVEGIVIQATFIGPADTGQAKAK
jgi:hypothetical protein